MTHAQPGEVLRTGRHTGSVLLAALLWGTTGTVAQFAPPGTDHTLVGVGTFAFGALVLLAVDGRAVAGLLRGVDRRTLAWLLLGAAGVITYAAVYYTSMSLIGVAMGNVLAMGSGPVFAALYELAIDRTRTSRRWITATFVAVLGIVLLSSGALSGADTASTRRPSAASAALGPAAAPATHLAGGDLPTVTLGLALALAAGASWALYSYTAAKLISAGHPSRSVMATVMGLASVVLLPWFLLAGPGALGSGAGPLVLAYLALLPMALAYLLYGYGLRGMSASTAVTLTLAEPLVATLLATVVLHERLTPVSWAGIALVLVGITLIARTPNSGNGPASA